MNFAIKNAAVFWCLSLAAQDSMILHVTQSGGGFTTDVVLRNNYGTTLPYHLTAFDSAGETLEELNGTLAALTSVRLASSEFFSVSGVSHFAKSNDTLISVGVSYQANTAGAGVANVLESAANSDFWLIQPGQQDLSWDGLAVVNRGSQATPIVVEQRDQQGGLIKSAMVHSGLTPNGKALYVLTSDFDLTHQNALFHIRTEQPVGVIALRGTPSNAVLWQNLAMPLPQDGAPDPQDFGSLRIFFRTDMDEDVEWVFPGGATGTARNLESGQSGPYVYSKDGRNTMIIELDLQPPHVFRMGLVEGIMGLYQEYVDGDLIAQGSFWMYL